MVHLSLISLFAASIQTYNLFIIFLKKHTSDPWIVSSLSISIFGASIPRKRDDFRAGSTIFSRFFIGFSFK